jgi:ADP-heptose:LPS heptosyltransferase
MYKPQILINRNMALGDVIQIAPIVKALYTKYNGNCYIDVSTRYPEVFKNNPYVRSAKPIAETNTTQYNVVVNLDWAYELDPGIHIQDAYKNVALGSLETIDGSINLYSTDEDTNTIKEYLESNNINGKYIVLHMRQVGIVDGRNFPIDFWSDVVELILDTTDAVIIQVGSGNDLSFDGDDRLFNALGVFTIHQLKELIAKSAVFVGSDSAPIHVAYSTDVPVVGLFTTVKSQYRSPRNRSAAFDAISANISCYGCKERLPTPSIDFVCGRGDVECVNCFDAAQVVDTIKKHL